ncbi:hypothetical protein TNCV_3912871 [Trichonephila clavipes]|nr:hypothetical protein TNCV_3912871 [Trichonephila clavipes]
MPPPNFYAKPTVGHLNLENFYMHWSPLHGGSSAVPGSSSEHAGYESIILTTRLPRPYSHSRRLTNCEVNPVQPGNRHICCTPSVCTRGATTHAAVLDAYFK